MATNETYTFGTTSVMIHTRFHVTPLASSHPAVATASVNGRELTDARGLPVERHAGAEDAARSAMLDYLRSVHGVEGQPLAVLLTDCEIVSDLSEDAEPGLYVCRRLGDNSGERFYFIGEQQVRRAEFLEAAHDRGGAASVDRLR